MAKQITKLIRSSNEFITIIRMIKAKYILMGKRPPSTSKITKLIAKRINKEELLKDVKDIFIPF
jgi:hypothetical protein